MRRPRFWTWTWAMIVGVSLTAVVGCGGSTSEPTAETSPGVTAVGDRSAEGTEQTGSAPERPSLRIVGPDGWATSADGLVIAELADDLNGVTPTGLRVVDITSRPPDQFLDDGPASLALASDPLQVTISGRQAMAIILLETSSAGSTRMVATVLVDTDGVAEQVLLIQGPSGAVDNLGELLATVLAP